MGRPETSFNGFDTGDKGGRDGAHAGNENAQFAVCGRDGAIWFICQRELTPEK